MQTTCINLPFLHSQDTLFLEKKKKRIILAVWNELWDVWNGVLTIDFIFYISQTEELQGKFMVLGKEKTSCKIHKGHQDKRSCLTEMSFLKSWFPKLVFIWL